MVGIMRDINMYSGMMKIEPLRSASSPENRNIEYSRIESEALQASSQVVVAKLSSAHIVICKV